MLTAILILQIWSIQPEPQTNVWSITSDSQREEVISESAFVDASESRREAARFYTVVFTASWCQPCLQYNQSGKLKHLQDRMPVTVVDIDEQPQWKKGNAKRPAVTRLPTFWLVDYETRQPVQIWVGSTDAEIIEAEAKRRSKPRYDDGIVPVPVSQPVQQMSHSEMKALHDRLHGGGSWSWPGDLREHLETVHGVDLGEGIRSKPVQVQSRGSSCPNGFCPQPQRRGLFGRLRR
jgi:thiol-disulfide isomerase/thioredoxin